MNSVGVTSLAPEQFTLDQATLSSASVDTAVEVSDSVNDTDFTVQVDVEWSAWGRYSTARVAGASRPSRSCASRTRSARGTETDGHSRKWGTFRSSPAVGTLETMDRGLTSSGR